MQLFGSSVCLANQGQRHLVRFPMGESEAEAPTAALPKVLVVDDERLLADTTAAILGRSGFIAKTAYDGFDALEAMASFHPECLLTDIMMPAMNGIELAIATTKMYPATKILLFSGQGGISNILEESRACGFEFPLLAKPVHPSRLIEELRKLRNG